MCLQASLNLPACRSYILYFSWKSNDRKTNLEYTQAPKSDPNLQQTSLKCEVIYSKGGGFCISLTKTSDWTLVLIQSVKTIGSFWFSLNYLAHCLSEVQITQARILWQFVHGIVIKSCLQRHNIRADRIKFAFKDEVFAVGGDPHWEFLRRPLKPQATFSFPGPFLIIPFFFISDCSLKLDSVSWDGGWCGVRGKGKEEILCQQKKHNSNTPEICSIVTNNVKLQKTCRYNLQTALGTAKAHHSAVLCVYSLGRLFQTAFPDSEYSPSLGFAAFFPLTALLYL